MYFYVVKNNIMLFICFKTNAYKLFIISNIKLKFISFLSFQIQIQNLKLIESNNKVMFICILNMWLKIAYYSSLFHKTFLSFRVQN